jgi:FtsZ-interacting cell division protein ZipA
MESAFTQLLAADPADVPIKIIFGAIVVVIWIIGGILSQLKKKADRERWNSPQPRQDWSHLLRDLTGGQAKPWNPNTPAPPPPHLPQQTPQQQAMHRQRMQQTKSFAQQSPRPFVQQYSQAPQVQQYPHRPLPPRRPTAAPLKAKPYQGPKQIQRKPKPQRRPPPIPAQAVQVVAPASQQSQGGIQDAIISMGPIQGQGGAIGVQSSTNASRHTAGPRLTSSQLRKLIVWSEVLAPPLSLREMSPK